MAETDLSGWLLIDAVAQAFGTSARTIERRAGEWHLEKRLRPQAGSPPVTVYNPEDVAREVPKRRPRPAPFVLEAEQDGPTNGNGRYTQTGIKNIPASTELATLGDDPIRQLCAALVRLIQSPPSPPVAESVAETLWVTVKEAAAILGFPQADVRRLLDDGDLNHRTTGRGGIRIRREDLKTLR